MSFQLTAEQELLHKKAVGVAWQYKKVEADLVQVLMQIDRCKLYKNLNCRSLFEYIVKKLGLSESVAYAFIAVARKSVNVPRLKDAIDKGLVTVATASRVVTHLTVENADQILKYTSAHSQREVESEMARLFPRAKKRDRVKPIDGETVELVMNVSVEVQKIFERVQAIESQRSQSHKILSDCLRPALEAYLEKHDPVRKAKRAQARKQAKAQDPSDDATKSQKARITQIAGQPEVRATQIVAQLEGQSTAMVVQPEGNSIAMVAQSEGHIFTVAITDEYEESLRSIGFFKGGKHEALAGTEMTTEKRKPLRSYRVPTKTKRKPVAAGGNTDQNRKLLRSIRVSAETKRRRLNAAEKHEVIHRDQGRCCFVNELGERCKEERWLHVHHIKPVSHGGTNEVSNLQTLCAHHHDLVHQLSFPIEGQHSWLRSRRKIYGIQKQVRLVHDQRKSYGIH